MSSYADALLRLAHRLDPGHRATVETFTIGTRLTHVTRAMRLRDTERALVAAGETVPDWSGGTRLGETLRFFLDRWGQRGMARGAVVVVFSDGWERGDAALLGEQMARLRRIAHRVVWVNPHRGKDGYEAVQQGVVAALPYLDDFVAGHSLATYAELVEVIARCVRCCRSCWSGGAPATRSASAPSSRPSAPPRARPAPRCWSAPTARPSARCRAAASRAPSTSSASRSSTPATPVLQRYGISDDDAFAVGLTCGGILDVYVEKVSRETFPELEDLAADLEAGRPVAVATVIEHPDPAWLGRRVVVHPDEPVSRLAGLGRAPTTRCTTTRWGCWPAAPTRR